MESVKFILTKDNRQLSKAEKNAEGWIVAMSRSSRMCGHRCYKVKPEKKFDRRSLPYWRKQHEMVCCTGKKRSRKKDRRKVPDHDFKGCIAGVLYT